MSPRQKFTAMLLLIKLFLLFVIEINGNPVKPIDLTWSFENATIYWPGGRNFEFTKQLTNDKPFWYAINDFCAAEHGGTHLDAPYHFYENGWKVGDIPIDRFLIKGAVIDISKQVEQVGSSRNLQEEDLVHWEKNHGPIPDNSVVLIKFGWSKFYSDKNKYLGLNTTTGKLDFPGLSAAAAQWLVTKTKIVGIGVDTASVDPGSSNSMDAHRILAHSNIYGLENVKLMNNNLPVRNFTLLVMPMNIALGTGAPLRLMAIEDQLFPCSPCTQQEH